VTRDDTPQEATITQTEAIRRAIAALGSGAQVPEILDYVWEHFGMGSGGAALAEAPERDPSSSPEKKAPPRRTKPRDRPSAE
jgi:hypothetical protein